VRRVGGVARDAQQVLYHFLIPTTHFEWLQSSESRLLTINESVFGWLRLFHPFTCDQSQCYYLVTEVLSALIGEVVNCAPRSTCDPVNN